MYSKPGVYKTYSQYSEKFAPQNKELPFYEFKSVEDKETHIKNADKLVVVDIYATWCGPCKEIAPKLRELSTKYKNQVVFFKENIEADLSPPNTVTAVPTFHFFYKGIYRPEFTLVGADLSALEKNINQFMENGTQ